MVSGRRHNEQHHLPNTIPLVAFFVVIATTTPYFFSEAFVYRKQEYRIINIHKRNINLCRSSSSPSSSSLKIFPVDTNTIIACRNEKHKCTKFCALPSNNEKKKKKNELEGKPTDVVMKGIPVISKENYIIISTKTTRTTGGAIAVATKKVMMAFVIAATMTLLFSTTCTPTIASATTIMMTSNENLRCNNDPPIINIDTAGEKLSSSLLLVSTVPPSIESEAVAGSSSVIIRLDSGVTYRDLREGGEGRGQEEEVVVTATEGKRVNIQWVLKRSNGYSIDSSSNNDGVPFIFVVGGGGGGSNNSNKTNKKATGQQQQRAIAGLDEGIRGMKVGGIRRIVIPPSLAYTEGLNDDGSSPGPIPIGFGPKQRIRRVMENRMDVPDESFLLDVKLTRIQ